MMLYMLKSKQQETKLLTDNSKKYEDMHRRDKHCIQENVTSEEGGKRKQLGGKRKH